MRGVCRVNGLVHVHDRAHGRVCDRGHANVHAHVNAHGGVPCCGHADAFCRLRGHATPPDRTSRAHGGLH